MRCKLLYIMLVMVGQIIAAPAPGPHASTTSFGGTTAAIDTTGVNLIVAFEFCGGAVSPPAPTDSQGNAWTVSPGGNVSDGASNTVNAWYVIGPSTSATHTFTANNAQCIISLTTYTGSSGGTDGNHVGAKMTTPTQALTAITPTVINDLFIGAGFEPTGMPDATFAPCNNENASTNCNNTHFTYAQLERQTVSSSLIVTYWGTTTSLNALTTVWKVNNSFNGLITHMAFKADAISAAGSNLQGPSKLVGPGVIQ
jgi:hypothetical protein